MAHPANRTTTDFISRFGIEAPMSFSGIVRAPWFASVAAVSAVALWGLAFPLIQDGLVYFSPVMLGFLRFLSASLVMVVVLLLLYPASKLKETFLREWRSLLLLGALYVTIPNIAQNMGLEHGTSSIASVIQSSGPVMTLLFATLLLKERLTVVKGVGSIIAMTGTVLLIANGGLSLQDEDFVSNLLILASATSYGLAWVSAKRMLERSPPMIIIGMSLMLGTMMLAIAVPFEPDSMAVFDSDSMTTLLLLGVLCGAGSSVLYLYSLEREEVSRMAFYIYLMPLFASIFAWLLRDETVALWTAVCGVIIIAGVAIAERGGHRSKASGP